MTGKASWVDPNEQGTPVQETSAEEAISNDDDAESDDDGLSDYDDEHGDDGVENDVRARTVLANLALFDMQLY